MPTYPFDQISTAADHRHGHTVQWRLAQSFKPVLPLTITLQVAETQAFQTVLEEIPATNSFYVTDLTRGKQDWVTDRFYRIKLQAADGTVTMSDPFSYDLDRVPRHKYLLMSEILRKEWVRMQFVGVQGWLLKKKFYGTDATQDIDPVSGVPITNNPLSLGTGLSGGYYPPVSLVYSNETKQQESKLDESGMGVQYRETTQLRCLNFPGVGVQDIIVAPDGKRWFVNDVQEKFFPGTHSVLLHVCQCRIIPNTDSVYNIEVGTT